MDDLGRGAEAYLQMWERAVGVPATALRRRARATRRGLGGVRLRARPTGVLRRAGQPKVRGARVWTYCVDRGRMTATLTPAGRVALVASTSPGHKARWIRTGMKAKRVKGAKAFGRGVKIKRVRGRAFVYGVRGGRVRYVAVATGSAVEEQGGAAAVSAARASTVARPEVNCGRVGSGRAVPRRGTPNPPPPSRL